MIEVTGAIIEKDGKILAARRKKDSHLGGFWEFPGGKIEPGETPEECLARELREELNINVSAGQKLGENTHEYPDRTINLILFFVKGDFENIHSDDNQELKWLSIQELDIVAWAPADFPLLEKLKKVRG